MGVSIGSNLESSLLIASNNIKWNSGATVYTSSTSGDMIAVQFLISKAGKIRVFADLAVISGSGSCLLKVNVASAGTQYGGATAGSTYTTQNVDVAVNPGDLIQVIIHYNTGTTFTFGMQNIKLCYDETNQTLVPQ